MGRKSTGFEVLGAARLLLSNSKTGDQLRTAQAVVLPLDFGMSLAQTAKIVGKSEAWVARTRMKFIRQCLSNTFVPTRGGRRNSLLSSGDEMLLYDAVRPNPDHYVSDPPPTGKALQAAIEKSIGRVIATSTAYNIIDRVRRAREKEDREYHQEFILSR